MSVDLYRLHYFVEVSHWYETCTDHMWTGTHPWIIFNRWNVNATNTRRTDDFKHVQILNALLPLTGGLINAKIFSIRFDCFFSVPHFCLIAFHNYTAHYKIWIDNKTRYGKLFLNKSLYKLFLRQSDWTITANNCVHVKLIMVESVTRMSRGNRERNQLFSAQKSPIENDVFLYWECWAR